MVGNVTPEPSAPRAENVEYSSPLVYERCVGRSRTRLCETKQFGRYDNTSMCTSLSKPARATSPWRSAKRSRVLGRYQETDQKGPATARRTWRSTLLHQFSSYALVGTSYESQARSRLSPDGVLACRCTTDECQRPIPRGLANAQRFLQARDGLRSATSCCRPTPGPVLPARRR